MSTAFNMNFVYLFPLSLLISPVFATIFINNYLNPSNNNNQPYNTPYLNIPYISELKGDNKGTPETKWYDESVLRSIKEKFTTVVLSHRQWNDFLSTTRPQRQSYPDIIIDYSYPTAPLNWNDAKNEISGEQTVINNVKLLFIPLAIDNTTGTTKISEHIKQFCTQINVTRFEFGCAIESQQADNMLSNATIENISKTCKNVGVKFFLFPIKLDLKKAQENDFPNSFFGNVVQKSLSELIRARQVIKRVIPAAVVYIRVISEPSSELGQNYPVTVFCNDNVLRANQYYKAVLNWAKSNKFPIILKSAFDSGSQPKVSSWMSMLRPTQSVSPFATSRPQIATTSPFFVTRNYPEGITGWKPDPCVTWSIGNNTTFLLPNFFKNGHTGAVLTLPIRDDGSIVSEEFQTMLQFILHKFSFFEVFSKTSSELTKFADANSPSFLDKITRNNLTQSAKLFIHYKFNELDRVNLVSLPTIYQKLREFQRNTIISSEGIHIDLSEIHDNRRPKNLIPMITNLIKSIGATKVGYVIPENCMDLFQQISSEIDADLQSVNYIVCKEWVDIGRRNEDDLTNLGQKFDAHLYIKKMLQQKYPSLSLYFKLEIDIDLSENQRENMDRYLRFLYHCQQFGVLYEIKYFLIEAFDKENNIGKRNNGWWSIKNYTDLTNLDVYNEKAAAHQGINTWKPTERLQRPARGENGPMPTSTLLIIVFSGVAVLFLLLLVAGSILVFWYKKVHTMYLTSKEVEDFHNEEFDTMENTDGNQTGCYKFSRDYELNLEDLAIETGRILGSGQFGIVFRGNVKGKEAAIKSPKQDCSKTSFKNELGEVKVLCHLGSHPHIVSFLGAYVNEIQRGKLYIATELCENGSLESYLRSKKPGIAFDSGGGYVNYNASKLDELLQQEMCQYALEIARGMEYIASKNVVHGDLATRNVLLDFNLVCKISDFGLSRKMYEYQKYVKTSQQPLPWKWMAVESLEQMVFTSKSDVWSYGVTIWEIYSLGNTPFGGLNYSPEFINDLKKGMRLPAPEIASEEIYHKFKECWNLNASERPSFTEMVGFFSGLRNNTEYLEIIPL